MGNREKLVRMVHGNTKRTQIFLIRFRDFPEFDENEVEEDVLRELSNDELLTMFEALPEDRERVLREEKYLVREEDGRFTAHNLNGTRGVYLVLD